MRIHVHFFAQARELAGCAAAAEDLPPGTTVGGLLDKVFARFPLVTPLRDCLRVAVGVDYQAGDYVLHDGDEISLLPPMQGG